MHKGCITLISSLRKTKRCCIATLYVKLNLGDDVQITADIIVHLSKVFLDLQISPKKIGVKNIYRQKENELA
jgi:hypothetical protein